MVNMDLSTRRVLAIVAVIAVALAAVYVVFLRPSGNEAPFNYLHHDPISIVGNQGFSSANGVTSGSGSSHDPYVIAGWEIGPTNTSTCINILNSDAHFVIRNVHLTHASRGVFFSDVINGRLEHSHLDNLSVGVTISESDTSAIVGNTIRDSGIGVQIMGSNNIQISGNHFVNDTTDVQKPSLPWELTWVGTAVCLAVAVPLAIVLIAAAYVRLKSRRGAP